MNATPCLDCLALNLPQNGPCNLGNGDEGHVTQKKEEG